MGERFFFFFFFLRKRGFGGGWGGDDVPFRQDKEVWSPVWLLAMGPGAGNSKAAGFPSLSNTPETVALLRWITLEEWGFESE